MTIDEIRKIVISPDAIMKKEYGKVLLEEIAHLTIKSETALIFYLDMKARAEKAEVKLETLQNLAPYLFDD